MTVNYGSGLLIGSNAAIAIPPQYLDACGTTQHLLGNLIGDLNGDEVRSRCYIIDMHLAKGDASEPNFRSLGDYHDRWMRIEGRWRLCEKRKLNRVFVGSQEVFGKI